MTALPEPLSVREGLAEATGLREGVSPSLEPALRNWIAVATINHESEVDRIMLRFELVVPVQRQQRYNREYAAYKAKRAELKAPQESQPENRLVVPYTSTLIPPARPERSSLAYDTPIAVLLDVVDTLLSLLPYRPPTQAEGDPVAWFMNGVRRIFQPNDVRGPLQQILDDARSVYTIRSDGLGLERRINAAAVAAGAQAIATAEQAGYSAAVLRLRSAWERTSALHPEPSVAYADAVRAVEAVACPLFLPADPSPTLGKVRKHLADSLSKYELVIADQQGAPASIETVVSMMGTLWFGHRDRHEGGPTSAPITQAAAETAVVLATALVQVLASGAVQPKP